MKTEILNFLTMVEPKRKMGFLVSVFGQKTENGNKNKIDFSSWFALGRIDREKNIQSHTFKLGTFFGRPNPQIVVRKKSAVSCLVLLVRHCDIHASRGARAISVYDDTRMKALILACVVACLQSARSFRPPLVATRKRSSWRATLAPRSALPEESPLSASADAAAAASLPDPDPAVLSVEAAVESLFPPRAAPPPARRSFASFAREVRR